MIENKATRDAFGDALVEYGGCDEKVVVIDCDLANPTKTSSFRDKYPERFLEFGIQEANAIGASAGIALSGFRPFVVSFASFITGRYDQIRISIAQENAPVVIVGTHSGLAIGKDGTTQMGLEDINLMRGLPNMTVIQPVDYYETLQAVKYLINANHPAYLRLGRQPLPMLNKPNCVFDFGKGVELKDGNDLSIIATGGMVHIALAAAEEIESEGISARVINIHTIKPLDEEIILKAAKETRGILTVEDHNIIGGLGSAVSEVMAEHAVGKKLKRIGIRDVFGESGNPLDLYQKHKIDKIGLLNEIILFSKNEKCNGKFSDTLNQTLVLT